jgi:hypothetical protein
VADNGTGRFDVQNGPYPDANGSSPTGWQASVAIGEGISIGLTVTVYAICVA